MLTIQKLSERSRFLVLAGFCVILYWNSLNCEFVFDDVSAIKDNKDLRPFTPLKHVFLDDFWGTPMIKEQSHKSYRPLTVLTFRWNYLLNELNPIPYHLVNLLLHMIVTIFCYKIFKIIVTRDVAFIASLLFAIHPIHTEAVTGIVGRAEILSSVFFLAAFWEYNKYCEKNALMDFVMFSFFVSCAMLSKEQGITINAICLVYDFFVISKFHIKDLIRIRELFQTKKLLQFLKRLSLVTSLTLLLLSGRFYIMGSQLPSFTKFDNPASVTSFPTKQLTYNYLASLNFWLLLFPCNLCCDWTMGTIPLVTDIYDSRNLTSLLFYSVFIFVIYIVLFCSSQLKTEVLIMGISFITIPFLPASNLFFPVGFVIAERVLYIPSMGFCLLIAQGYVNLKNRINCRWIELLMLSLLITFSFKTYLRNEDWKNEYSLFMSGLRVNQRNAKLFNNVGHALENQERYEEALKYFQKAVEVQSDDIGAHINVGRTYNQLKMYKEAEEAYNKAKSLLPRAKRGESYQTRIAPNHLNVFLNLANLISKNTSRLEEADNLYQQAISMRSDYIQAYINRGDILMKLNRTEKAREVYEQALLYEKENPDIHYNLGVVFLELNRTSEALDYLEKALILKPNHAQALLNSGILLQEIGGENNRKLAKERLLKLVSEEKDNDRAYFNLGMIAMDDNDMNEAELWFREAIKLKEDFRSALFNLALLLADLNKSTDAEVILQQLIKHHPDHVKGYNLLGDIYTNQLRNLSAAEYCYRKILQLDPVNIQGLHNLCVVYAEQGKLLDAYKCLKKAHKLAPHEDYIQRHLRIIEGKVESVKKKLVINEKRKKS